MKQVVMPDRQYRIGLAILFFVCLGLTATHAQQENLGSRSAVIQIRSAFSLSPVMVKAIQAVIKEDLSRPNADSLDLVPWNEPFIRVVPLAVPLDVQLTGSNVVVHIQILPTILGAQSAELIIQGQIWAKVSDNTLSFNTTLQTISVGWGSRFFFYPLGMDAKTGAPIVMEIRLDRQKAQ